MINNLQNIAPSIEDATIRFELNNYFINVLPKKKKEMSKTEKDKAASILIREHPEIIDYYIKYKEEKEEEATSISKQVVQEVKQLFNTQLQELTPVFVKQVIVFLLYTSVQYFFYTTTSLTHRARQSFENLMKSYFKRKRVADKVCSLRKNCHY
ncbi:MAG: hypothetical protein ACOX27_05055 [Caldicoprobacterales bacterium]